MSKLNFFEESWGFDESMILVSKSFKIFLIFTILCKSVELSDLIILKLNNNDALITPESAK